MDPQNQLSGLDPKLKEAYERVMGTSIPPVPQEPTISAPTSQTEPTPPQPTNEPPKEPASPPVQEPSQEPTPPPPVTPPQPPEPAEPPLQQPELAPIPPPVQPPAAQNEPASSPVQAAQPTGFVANAPKKGKLAGLKISRPILISIGVGLLVLYVFFWIRVFNLSLF